jgi:hypothetical protein
MTQNPKLFPVQGPIKPLDVSSTEIQFPARALTLATIVHNGHSPPGRTSRFAATVSNAKNSRPVPPVTSAVSIRNMHYIKSTLSTKTSADVDLYENKFQYRASQSPQDSARYPIQQTKSTHRILADVSPGNRPMNFSSRSGVAPRISQGTSVESPPSVRHPSSRDAWRHFDGSPSNVTPRTARKATRGKENAPINLSIEAS